MGTSKATNSVKGSLEAMQALAAIHSAIEQLSQIQLERLNSLDLAAIQSYYALVKQKLLEQEKKFSSLPIGVDSTITPQDAASISKEPTKTRQSKKTANSSRKQSKSESETVDNMDAYLEFYEDLKAGFADLE